jgi:hypothetical protein
MVGSQGCQMTYVLSYQKYRFVYVLECLGMENISHILLSFGYLVHFSDFGMLHRKNLATLVGSAAEFFCVCFDLWRQGKNLKCS